MYAIIATGGKRIDSRYRQRGNRRTDNVLSAVGIARVPGTAKPADAAASILIYGYLYHIMSGIDLVNLNFRISLPVTVLLVVSGLPLQQRTGHCLCGGFRADGNGCQFGRIPDAG